MTGLFIFVHTIACFLLIIVILMQSGRGGGLTEGFAAAESMFGAKTNEFMVRATTILASIFLVTSLTLAYFSAQRDRSLIPMQQAPVEKSTQSTAAPAQEEPVSTAPAAEEVPVPAQ